MYYVDATQIMLAELKGKYMEVIDALISIDGVNASFDIEQEENSLLEGGQRKQADTDTLIKKNNYGHKQKQLVIMLPDFFPKYKHFASLIGIKVDKTIKNIAGYDINVGMIDADTLKSYRFECEQKIVQCDSYLYSYPTILARNDKSKDKDNIKQLELNKKRTETSKADLLNKIIIIDKL